VPKQLYGRTSKKPAGSKPESVQEAPEQATPEPAPAEVTQAPPAEATQAPPTEATQAPPTEAVDTLLPSRPVALADLPLDAIIPSRAQARRPESLTQESLADLVASMKTHGLLTRIRVRQLEGNDEQFELVFGERRWRAARLAGFTHYPVEIASYTDDELAEIGLIENIQRKDLSPFEEAEKYRQLLALTDAQGQPKYSIRKLAERIGKDKGYVEDRLAVLRAPEDVQQLVQEQPEVPLRVARELTKVEQPEDRAVIIEQVRAGTLRKDDVRAVVREVRVRTRRTSLTVSASRTSSALVGQSETQQADPAAPPLLEPAPLQSAAVRIIFEQTLRRDDEALQKVFFRLHSTIETLSEIEREIVLDFIDRWERSLHALKRQLQGQETSP
jgi:ParB family transcriptional regulator, chromosome partitioning protein